MGIVKVEKDPSEVRYNRNAKFYDFFYWVGEKLYFSRYREDILRDVKGKTLEVGIGTGKTFKLYPSKMDIVAIDISGEMLRRAVKRAKLYKGKVELRREDVQHLSFEKEKFDTVFASWVFCSVTDPVKGLRGVHRVLKKGGNF